MLGKGYYSYEDADSWEKVDKAIIPPKEGFHSELNLEGISDADYAHVQKVWEVFEIKNFGEYLITTLICSKWYIAAGRCIWKV